VLAAVAVSLANTLSLYLWRESCACRSLYTDITYWTPGMQTSATTCYAISSGSVQQNPSPSDVILYEAGGPVPGWLSWFGEMGIGLPLIHEVGVTGFRACYWSFNWGRIVLQNVTIFASLPEIYPEMLYKDLTVTQTGERGRSLCVRWVPAESTGASEACQPGRSDVTMMRLRQCRL
jgi:hypothetical protein